VAVPTHRRSASEDLGPPPQKRAVRTRASVALAAAPVTSAVKRARRGEDNNNKSKCHASALTFSRFELFWKPFYHSYFTSIFFRLSIFSVLKRT
jgi:hypothetical protein